MNSAKEYNIVISPIEGGDAVLFKLIRKTIERIFGYPTRILPILDDVKFSLDPAREQYYSTMILEKLENASPADVLKIVAITHVDLFIPILTYVFGEAQLGGRACIVSTHRLKDGVSSIAQSDTYYLRVVKEAIHELGHTFGLRHCPDHSCIMHYCRAIADVDRKSDQFCRYCTVMLEDEKAKLISS